MLTKIVSGILWVVVPFFAVMIAFAQSSAAGFITFGLILVIMLVVFRAQVFTLIGQFIFQSNHGTGFKWFERALKTGKMKPEAVLIYAYLLIRDGVLDKSEEIINKILFLKKKELKFKTVMSAKLNRSLIKWKKGDLKAAIEEADEIYNAGFRSSVFYGAYGYLYILDGQYTKAIEINKEAYEYSSNDNIITDNLAQNLMLTGDVFAAEKMYKELLAKEPGFIEPYYNYAMLLKNKGDNKSAIKYLEKALTYPEKFLSTVSHKEIASKLNELKGVPNTDTEVNDDKTESEFDIDKFIDFGSDNADISDFAETEADDNE